MIILVNLVVIGAEAEMTVQNMDTSWARFAELSFLVTWLGLTYHPNAGARFGLLSTLSRSCRVNLGIQPQVVGHARNRGYEYRGKNPIWL